VTEPATLSVFEIVIPEFAVASTVAEVPPKLSKNALPAVAAAPAQVKKPVPMQVLLLPVVPIVRKTKSNCRYQGTLLKDTTVV
jgi:hypothetical protein